MYMCRGGVCDSDQNNEVVVDSGKTDLTCESGICPVRDRGLPGVGSRDLFNADPDNDSSKGAPTAPT